MIIILENTEKINTEKRNCKINFKDRNYPNQQNSILYIQDENWIIYVVDLLGNVEKTHYGLENKPNIIWWANEWRKINLLNIEQITIDDIIEKYKLERDKNLITDLEIFDNYKFNENK